MNIINSELIKPNCLVILSTVSAPQFLSKLSPLINEKASLTLPSGCFKRIDATASCQLLAMKILHCDKIRLEVCRHKLPGYHYKRRTCARLRELIPMSALRIVSYFVAVEHVTTRFMLEYLNKLF